MKQMVVIFSRWEQSDMKLFVIQSFNAMPGGNKKFTHQLSAAGLFKFCYHQALKG